jgi:uncharacterized protein with GYD domain
LPRYVSLIKYTDQGIRDVGRSAQRVRSDSQENARYGVTLASLYMTMGEYDFVGIWDAPDDESMTAALLHHGRKGNISTVTMRAFNLTELKGIVDRLD